MGTKAGEKIVCTAKSPVASKLNWTGLGLVVLGMLTDPMFRSLFGEFIPEQWLSRIVFLSGFAVIGFRTLGTSGPVSLDWRNPWG